MPLFLVDACMRACGCVYDIRLFCLRRHTCFFPTCSHYMRIVHILYHTYNHLLLALSSSSSSLSSSLSCASIALAYINAVNFSFIVHGRRDAKVRLMISHSWTWILGVTPVCSHFNISTVQFEKLLVFFRSTPSITTRVGPKNRVCV